MSEQPEDLNAFNSWDNFGATLMLGLVPAIMYYVFSKDAPVAPGAPPAEPDLAKTIFIAFIGFLASLAVLGVSLVTRWRIIGKMVNLTGGVLTIIYIAIAALHWYGDDTPPPADAAQTPAISR